MSTIGTRRGVTVVVPKVVSHNGKEMEAVIQNVLNHIGCQRCHSGFDLNFVEEEILVASVGGEVRPVSVEQM